MGILISKADVSATDQTADQLVQMFATLGDTLTLNHTFDMDDPKERGTAERIVKAEKMLAEAQESREQGELDHDDVAIATADSQILAMTNFINAAKDKAFGYFVKDSVTGALGYLKGSMLDKIDKALIDLNKRTDWLGGKSVRKISVDDVNHRIVVARVDKKVRTRTMRPTMDSALEQLASAFDKVVTADIPADE